MIYAAKNLILKNIFPVITNLLKFLDKSQEMRRDPLQDSNQKENKVDFCLKKLNTF